MFNLFKKKQQEGSETTIKIGGMHCTSCAINIDGELEELDGVISANTTYASAVTKVKYDPEKVDKKSFQEVIEKLGYSVAK